MLPSPTVQTWPVSMRRLLPFPGLDWRELPPRLAATLRHRRLINVDASADHDNLAPEASFALCICLHSRAARHHPPAQARLWIFASCCNASGTTTDRLEGIALALSLALPLRARASMRVCYDEAGAHFVEKRADGWVCYTQRAFCVSKHVPRAGLSNTCHSRQVPRTYQH